MNVYNVKDYLPKVAKNIDITALFGARGQAVKNIFQGFQKRLPICPVEIPNSRGV